MLNIAREHTAVRPAHRAGNRGTGVVSLVDREARTADSCSSCCLKGVCLPSGLAGRHLGTLDALTAVKRRIARGAALYRSGDAFESIYAIRSGAFKNVGVSTRGEEKITGFFLPGEVLGLDAINASRHQFNAIALEDSEVCVVSFSRLQEAARDIPELQSHLFRLISRDISRDQGLMLLLGSMTAEQRLAAFLMSLSRRYQSMGYAAHRFNLRMTREDVGNYLGLTLETVSRFLSRFQREGTITIRQRAVEITNADALMQIVGSW